MHMYTLQRGGSLFKWDFIFIEQRQFPRAGSFTCHEWTISPLYSRNRGSSEDEHRGRPSALHSVSLNFFPFLFIPRKKQMSWRMAMGLALDNRINFLPVKRRKRVSGGAYREYSTSCEGERREKVFISSWWGFFFTALNSSQLINTLTGTLHLWRHFFLFGWCLFWIQWQTWQSGVTLEIHSLNSINSFWGTQDVINVALAGTE